MKEETSLYIKRLSLSNFRNYDDLRLELTAAPVILAGQNGSGKTNLLEAISLLVPGRGLCRAAPSEWQRHDSTRSWGLVVDMETPIAPVQIATGRDPEKPEQERRIVQIDGQRVRSQQELASHVSMAWITPDLDRVLAEGPSARRRLLDRMAYSFDPAHSGRVHRYEKAMRERLRLLRDGVQDPVWLSGLEDEMARSSLAIAAARRQLTAQLAAAIEETVSVFPHADIGLIGLAEEALEDQAALLVEDQLRDALASSRLEDAQSGRAKFGAHRADLQVWHREKNCPADLCSTGEQKALLVAMMLAYVRILKEARQMPPLFLLDDITAHFDQKRREALFEEILSLRLQAWLTGTDEADFGSLLAHSQLFSVYEGQISAF